MNKNKRKQMSKPIKKTPALHKEKKKPFSISVWNFAQDCFSRRGKGIVFYGGLGHPASYNTRMVFNADNLEAFQEIKLAMEKYNPEKELVIAVPQEDDTDMIDIMIIKKDHPYANLKLGMNTDKHEFV